MNDDVTIVGFAGKARSGKDAAGDILVHYGFKKMAFADSLKAACREVFGFSVPQLYGSEKEEEDPFWGFSPRHALQQVGTEAFRHIIGDDVWVKSLERRIVKSVNDKIVVVDVRFRNEAEAIQRWGGRVYKIVRPQHEVIATSQHASETALDDWGGWDGIVDNSGTLDELEHRIKVKLARGLVY